MSDLQKSHPVQSEEITPFGIWLLTRIMIASAALLLVTPFVLNYVSQ